MSSPKIAIVIYSMYGHIAKSALFFFLTAQIAPDVESVAEAIKEGIKEAGGDATIFQIPETLSAEVLKKMSAPAKPDYPIIDGATLATFDAFLMGIPTRFGSFPTQWKAFWDNTSDLWATGALAGKYAGTFVATASLGGGQEATIQNTLGVYVHHSINFVPLGYAHTFAQLTNLSEVHGGSPWGSGTLASADGSRQPSALELEIAHAQGKAFYGVVSKVKF